MILISDIPIRRYLHILAYIRYLHRKQQNLLLLCYKPCILTDQHCRKFLHEAILQISSVSTVPSGLRNLHYWALCHIIINSCRAMSKPKDNPKLSMALYNHTWKPPANIQERTYCTV